MEQRQLGASGISVSVLGFGMWTLSTGWWGEVSDDQAINLLREARALGVNFFDASDSYGDGRAEHQLGVAFGNDPDVVVATKVGYDFYSFSGDRRGQQEITQDFSSSYIRQACDQSLQRLRREYIDFYQLHNPKMDTIERAETFACLDDLKRAGKIRSYGVALGPAIGWELEGVKAARDREIAGLQIIYNMLEQDPGRTQIAACRAAGRSAIARVPHSSGLLEGNYDENTVFGPNDHRRHRPRSWLINGLKKIEELRFLTDARPGSTLGQIALNWILSDPVLATVLPNIYGSDQLQEFARIGDIPPLTSQELARVQALYETNFGLSPETENAVGAGSQGISA